MRSRYSTPLLAALVLLAAGCASTGEPDSADESEFISRDVLTYSQIQEVRATNAYEAVERLKSHWLRPQGRSQMPTAPGVPQFQENPVLAYLDDQRLGSVEQLRGIEIAAVQYIQYFSPSEAATRWGFNHGGGAVLVSTRPYDP
ncbi:MAG: hypothetical protein P8177_06350 [Gemmatimonadota bacterium]|jgi:hypothetical protein